MTWQGEIRAIKLQYLDDDGYWQWLIRDGFWPDTILLKHRGKVAAVCSIEEIYHNPIQMCTFETEYYTYGLTLKKIRRPGVLEKFVNQDDMTVGAVLRTWNWRW